MTTENAPSTSQSNSRWPQIVIYLTLTLLALTATGLLWISLKILLTSPYELLYQPFKHLSPILFTTLGLILTFSALITITILIKKTVYRTIFLLLISSSIWILYPEHNIAILTTSSTLMFLMLLLTDFIFQKDIQLHLKPALVHIFDHRLIAPVFAFSILLSFLIYDAGVTNLDKFEITIPEKLINQGLELANPILESQLGEQAQELFIQEGIRQLDEQLPILRTIPTEDKVALLQGEPTEEVRALLTQAGLNDQQIDGLANNFYEGLNVEVGQAQENLTNNIYVQAREQVLKTLNSFVQKNRTYLPWILSISTFMLLTSISFLIRFLSVVIASLLLRIFVMVNVVEIKTENTERMYYEVKL